MAVRDGSAAATSSSCSSCSACSSAPALVIATKATKLGLDLSGGNELIYQGQPTAQDTTVDGEDIDRAIEIIRDRVDALGVSEPEIARLGTDQISVGLPDVTNAQRAIDQVGTTAQLYFYDFEPNVIDREQVIGGRPGQQPPPGRAREPRTSSGETPGATPNA